MDLIRVEGDTQDRADNAIILRSTLSDPAPGEPTTTSRLFIPKVVETRLRSEGVEISIVARAAAKSLAMNFHGLFNVTSRKFWLEKFTPTSDFATYNYNVTKTDLDPTFDFLGIHTDTFGTGKGMEIESLTVSALPKFPGIKISCE